MIPIVITREMRRQLERDNARLPAVLTPIAKAEWIDRAPPGVIEVWRSRTHLVQVYAEANGIERLSICRSVVAENSDRWQDGLTWDELQGLKRECGRGDKFAVEVFPADRDIVNVANLRHLWILPEPPAFAWRAP